MAGNRCCGTTPVLGLLILFKSTPGAYELHTFELSPASHRVVKPPHQCRITPRTGYFPALGAFQQFTLRPGQDILRPDGVFSTLALHHPRLYQTGDDRRQAIESSYQDQSVCYNAG